jgi:hypothetical protein
MVKIAPGKIRIGIAGWTYEPWRGTSTPVAAAALLDTLDCGLDGPPASSKFFYSSVVLTVSVETKRRSVSRRVRCFSLNVVRRAVTL